MQDEVITNKFKLFALSFVTCLTLIVVLISAKNAKVLNAWMTLIIVQQGLCWACLGTYVALWRLSVPSKNVLIALKLIFLFAAGPCFLIISFYAFYTDQNLHYYFYFFSFLSWSFFFCFSIYGTFKLILELSMILHRRTTKKKLTDHYKMINFKSIG